jgi:hypothetical protein
MTACKRCPRCGQLKAAEKFYRRRRSRRLSSYCQPCQRAASQEARAHQRENPTSAEMLRAVDRTRQRRQRTVRRQSGEGS